MGKKTVTFKEQFAKLIDYLLMKSYLTYSAI